MVQVVVAVTRTKIVSLWASYKKEIPRGNTHPVLLRISEEAAIVFKALFFPMLIANVSNGMYLVEIAFIGKGGLENKC